MSRSRYSMEQREAGLSKLYTDDEKFDILYRQLVLKQNLAEIYKVHKKTIKFEYFKTIPSILLNQRDLLSKVLKHLTTKTHYEEGMGIECKLGQKEVSYWESEDDIFFKPIKPRDLSEEEQLIYYNKKK